MSNWCTKSQGQGPKAFFEENVPHLDELKALSNEIGPNQEFI
jgi:hypothetical protein